MATRGFPLERDTYSESLAQREKPHVVIAIDLPFVYDEWEEVEPVDLSNTPELRRYRIDYDAEPAVIDLSLSDDDRTAQQRDALLQLWERKYGS